MVEKPIDWWLTLIAVLSYLIVVVGISGVFIAAFKRRRKRRMQVRSGRMECPNCHKTIVPWLWENQKVKRYLCPSCGHPLDQD